MKTKMLAGWAVVVLIACIAVPSPALAGGGTTGAFSEFGAGVVKEWPVYWFVSVFGEIRTGMLKHPMGPLRNDPNWMDIIKKLPEFSLSAENFHVEMGVKGVAFVESGLGLAILKGYNPLPYLMFEMGYILPHFMTMGQSMSALKAGLGRLVGQATKVGQAARALRGAKTGAEAAAAAATVGESAAVKGTLGGLEAAVQEMRHFDKLLGILMTTTESGWCAIYYIK